MEGFFREVPSAATRGIDAASLQALLAFLEIRRERFAEATVGKPVRRGTFWQASVNDERLSGSLAGRRALDSHQRRPWTLRRLRESPDSALSFSRCLRRQRERPLGERKVAACFARRLRELKKRPFPWKLESSRDAWALRVSSTRTSSPSATSCGKGEGSSQKLPWVSPTQAAPLLCPENPRRRSGFVFCFSAKSGRRREKTRLCRVRLAGKTMGLRSFGDASGRNASPPSRGDEAATARERGLC